jgi:hypothetical protein
MKLNIIKYVMAIGIMLVQTIGFANQGYDPYLVDGCSLSMPIDSHHLHTMKANPINDLTKEHQPYLSNYDKAYIYGRVLDQDCKPIADVNIKIWQNDYKMLELSGMTTTNNLGEFIFVSFIPDNTIKLKILITHDEYFPFLTSTNLTSYDSFKSKNIILTSSWLLANPSKYNQNYIYHKDIVIPTQNLKIRY